MSLSILIPVYNEIDQLKYTLNKLIKLKKKINNFEIIFIDDFSNDGSGNYIKEYSKKKPYIKIFKNKKKGLGSPLLNRLSNNIIKFIFFSNYNDFTNAFKIYKRKTLIKLLPIISENFNVFLELPLKIITRNYSYKIIPISWNGRSKGKSKFKIKEMGSMYIFTLLYCVLEKILLKKNI